MVKVITYGTYDLLHYGHVRLLERAKALGDYLIVGVTADDFDKVRGKINVQQSLMERVEAVRATGIADEIIIEEYEGQKIDDIKRYDVDIFTVGSDWVGYFDYLNEYCKVIYLERTQGVSSTELRSHQREIKLGLVGEVDLLEKVYNESKFANGLTVSGVFSRNKDLNLSGIQSYDSYDQLLDNVEAVYVASEPHSHYNQIKVALEKGKHVLCETPTSTLLDHNKELIELAKKNNCILMDGLKTAYATAYSRMLVLVKSGKIGDVVSVEATCTSLIKVKDQQWNSFYYWGPTALLPVFNLLGTRYVKKNIIKRKANDEVDFVKIDFMYDHSVGTVKVGNGVKSEGELVISGTKGYIYIPSPWWKTDYFEIRYEDQSQNKRYFYQLDGEGIRYELVSFSKSIQLDKNISYIDSSISNAICMVVEEFDNDKDCYYI